MERLISTKEYNIHFYEIDYSRKALITTIINYLGDSAIQQSEDIGVGIDWLFENNLGWVLYKWDITVKRFPVLNEKISVRTWPLSFRKFYAYRQYEIMDEEGEVIATADSIWFLIDTNRKRPTKVSNGMYQSYRLTEEDNEIADFGQLQMPEEVTTEKIFDVRYSDIDTNKHVNNAKYVDWCVETVPLEVLLNYTLTNIKVIYEKETKYGDRIKAICQVIEEGDSIICIHKIEDEDGKKLTLARTQWCKK